MIYYVVHRSLCGLLFLPGPPQPPRPKQRWNEETSQDQLHQDSSNLVQHMSQCEGMRISGVWIGKRTTSDFEPLKNKTLVSLCSRGAAC